jgi:hypothetical protein
MPSSGVFGFWRFFQWKNCHLNFVKGRHLCALHCAFVGRFRVEVGHPTKTCYIVEARIRIKSDKVDIGLLLSF